jgi:cyclic pyranopterin phosphate synthase
MDSIDFWKILRILTTNACNYKCIFCHNEGQEAYDGLNSTMLKLKDFQNIIQALQHTGIKEIQFSGGEPFLNPETIKMIVWANEHTNFEIGCASNTQFFDDEIIKELARTRIKLHIQCPTLNQKRFERITGTHLFGNLHENLQKLKSNKIEYSLNYVLISQNIDDFQEFLPFLLENKINLKILPFINNNTLNYNKFKRKIIPFLNSLSFNYENMNNGSLKWWIKTYNGETINIKYIDSPCFYSDFNTCKHYAEIRLLPDLTLQSCLIDPSKKMRIDFELCEENFPKVRKLFQQAWENFTHC